jgi:hypothetical protein
MRKEIKACFSNIRSCRLRAFALLGLRAYAAILPWMSEGMKSFKNKLLLLLIYFSFFL